ncbi:MAG TPA: hypothetical protein VKA60_06750 [Blastocatellia bacterium]|nr:hypothetical protein [Blastocatellia bacterium]
MELIADVKTGSVAPIAILTTCSGIDRARLTVEVTEKEQRAQEEREDKQSSVQAIAFRHGVSFLS